MHILKIGFLVTLFESNGKKSGTGMKRALLALQLAKEINDNPEILPSYEVFFLNLICSGLELMI